MARRLRAAGATVVVADVDVTRGKFLAEEFGPPSSFHAMDVTDPSAWTEMAAKLETLGAPRLVHLNAGVMLRPAGTPALDDPLDWMTVDSYRRIRAINLDGVVYGILAMAPIMEAAGGGWIVVTSSNAGLDPFAMDPAYALTKHALIGLVESLAPALARRSIDIMALCPAGIDTQMCPPDFRDMRLREHRSFAAPSYVAEAVMTMLAHGRPGQIWMSREQDGGYWVYDRPRLPALPAEGAQLWPAS